MNRPSPAGEPDMPPSLSDADMVDLAAVLETLIPALPARGLPSASEVMLHTLCDDGAELVTIRACLSSLQGWIGAAFADLPEAQRVEHLARLERERVLEFRALLRGVAMRYYVDDRVLRAIGEEPRPPFPDGYRVDDGDLLQLESVFERGPIWRLVVPPPS